MVNLLQNLTAYFQQKCTELGLQDIQLLPPFSAPMAKKAGHYRWLLLIQHRSRGVLQQLIDQFDLDKANLGLQNNIRLTLDIDPQEIG
ncbi:primosome assembly protein PriA [Actinobacillus pleuropneumoniae]|nr:primosome assembly protein PriA [Actinobacillus pleuropneumoniae]